MATSQLLLFLPAITASLQGAVSEVPYGDIRQGHATYYSWADGTGACMLEELPEPQYVGALNDPDYLTPSVDGTTFANATLCGAYARVTGNKGSITIKMVDRCPDDICVKGHIDLSPEAFAAIDDISLGYVPITWQLVSAPISGPVRLRYKDGSSQWWTAIQVRNHRTPVATLEAWANGQWKALSRTSYNYFVESDGLGVGYHSFRITDIFGRQIIETSTIYLGAYQADAVEWKGEHQFPPP